MSTLALLTPLLIIIAYCRDVEYLLIYMALFFMIFEFGPGPVCWIYMSEVANDKGVAVATALNWTFTLLYSFSIFGLKNQDSYLKYLLSVPCGLAAIMVFFFVKETKGLSEQELQKLYRSDVSKMSESTGTPLDSSGTDLTDY